MCGSLLLLLVSVCLSCLLILLLCCVCSLWCVFLLTLFCCFSFVHGKEVVVFCIFLSEVCVMF